MNVLSDRLCECGCGKYTPITPRTDARKGWTKGEPLRFRRGHNIKMSVRKQRILTNPDLLRKLNYEKGLTFREIAKKLGVHESTVQRAFKHFGIPPRINTHQRGRNNPAYKHGKRSMTGSHWYRDKALKAYGPRCAKCGYDRHLAVLHVHHKDGNSRNHAIDNLEVLCANCHKERHLGLS